MIERISDGDEVLAYVIRAQMMPDRTTFVTPPESKQQVGFFVYSEGGEVARHVHLPVERTIVGNSEVLLVREGRCEVDIYSDDRRLVATRELGVGDVVVMIGGGHGLRMLEDTVLFAIKQGPYAGPAEKERF